MPVCAFFNFFFLKLPLQQTSEAFLKFKCGKSEHYRYTKTGFSPLDHHVFGLDCISVYNSKRNLCQSHNRRWDRSLEGGRRVAFFCLETVSSGMEPHNGPIHARANNILTFRPCDWTTCVDPTHLHHHHSGIVDPSLLSSLISSQVGQCHSARPSSNSPIRTLSKSLSSSPGEENPRLLRFCLFFPLWRIVPILLCNPSGFFLPCLDIFVCSSPVCFLQHFKD